ncbi:hypothetical protein ACQY0O_001812 [Thecaphora frezii]
MQAAQTSSPSAGRQSLFPSPTYSDSSLSSSSNLCTPDNSMKQLSHDGAKRKDAISSSISAANAAFFSATERDEFNAVFGNPASSITAQEQDEGEASLASALKFDAMGAGMNGIINNPSFSFLGKRQASNSGALMQPPADAPANRRHSIQPILTASGSSSSLNDPLSGSSSLADLASSGSTRNLLVTSRSMSLSADASSASAPSSSTALGMPVLQPSSNEFLMSPPRLTVSMSMQGTPTPTAVGAADALLDDNKRRRTSDVEATPDRNNAAQAVLNAHHAMPHYYQHQTPPSFGQYQQHVLHSSGSSSFTLGPQQTPSTTAGTHSVQSSVSSRRVRKVSLCGGEGGSSGSSSGGSRSGGASEIASLTAGLSLPKELRRLDEAAKSAPPRAAADGMQRTPSQCKSNTPSKLSHSNSANDKNKSQDVWPDDVEVAFWEALRLIPKLGRRKVLVHGKPCGRNELIADYIERKTNKTRTRKQVSSHIQVLKNIKKGDPEFQQLIAEPTSEEDFYIPAGGMMYAQTLAGYGYGGLGGPYPLLSMDSVGLLSPYTPGVGPHGLASPITPGAPPMSATGSITSALNDLHFPHPPNAKDQAGALPCPILPASFSMWVHCSSSDDKHIYTSLNRNAMTAYANGQSSLPRLSLDSVRVGHFRFPRLAEMYHHMPCQFLHVHVPLSIPRHDIMMPRYDHFSTQLSLTSAQDSRLTSVTSVYSHGKRVLSLVEPLDAPRRISGRSGSDSGTAANTATAAMQPKSDAGSGSGSPEGDAGAFKIEQSDSTSSLINAPTASSSQPLSPAPMEASNSRDGLTRHRWCHQAPFATDFWADFLSRNHPVNVYNDRDGLQSFGKEPSERAALGMAVSGVTIIQELVVAPDDSGINVKCNGQGSPDSREVNPGIGPTLLPESASSLSPGSKVGDVVLVIAWDLECVEALGTNPGTPTVSMLTIGTGASPSPLGRQVGLPSPLHGQAFYPMQNQHPSSMAMGGAPPPLPAVPQQHLQHYPPQPYPMQQSHSQGYRPATPPAPPALVQTQPSPQPNAQQSTQGPQPLNLDGSSTFGNGLQPLTLFRKRGLSVNKPPLMVAIPPAPSYLNPNKVPNSAMISPATQQHSPMHSPSPAAWGLMQQRAMLTPITPFPQVSAAPPTEPPPIVTGDEARQQKERLARHWAAEAANGGASLHSPLDMVFGPGVHGSTSAIHMASATALDSSTTSALGMTGMHLSVTGPDGSNGLLSPATFDFNTKMLVGEAEAGLAPSSEHQLMLGTDQSTQEYIDGLLASIGVTNGGAGDLAGDLSSQPTFFST